MTPASRRRVFIGIAIAAGLVAVIVAVAVFAALHRSGDSPDYVSVDGSVATWTPDKRGPALTMAGDNFDGEAVTLDGLRGSVVVLNTWYAGCAPCRGEAPDLVAFANDYAGKGVTVLGLNSVDDAATAAAFERTFDVPYSSLHDADGAATRTLNGIVPLNAVPTTVILDADGRVAARIIGAIDPSTLRSLVDDLLAEG